MADCFGCYKGACFVTLTLTKQGVRSVNNIDRFNECTAKLFASLYSAFPQPLDVDFFEWLGKEVFEVGDDELEFCGATVKWLEEAQYIRVKTYSGSSVYGLVLTAKGLEVLKVVPDSINNKGSLGDALVDAMKKGMTSAGSKIVAKVFTEGFTLL